MIRDVLIIDLFHKTEPTIGRAFNIIKACFSVKLEWFLPVAMLKIVAKQSKLNNYF